MSWLKRLWRVSPSLTDDDVIRLVCLTMTGWSEEKTSGELREWRGPHNAILSLASLVQSALPQNERALQQWSRELAESQGGGLIEVSIVNTRLGTTVRVIYKRLQMPAYVYTGMLIFRMTGFTLVWTVVADECVPTGIREAVVTAELLKTGRFRVQDYEHFWAQDPYDASYHGVRRSVLRFMSDDESHDHRFPDHPLSRVRQVLAELPNCIQFDPQVSHRSGA
jgi:hypothetical protein